MFILRIQICIQEHRYCSSICCVSAVCVFCISCEMLFLHLALVIVFPTHGTLGYPDPLTSEPNTLFVARSLWSLRNSCTVSCGWIQEEIFHTGLLGFPVHSNKCFSQDGHPKQRWCGDRSGSIRADLSFVLLELDSGNIFLVSASCTDLIPTKLPDPLLGRWRRLWWTGDSGGSGQSSY